MLAEAATKDITNADHLQEMVEHIEVAKRDGNVAKVAKDALEKETGKPVITKKNAIVFSKLIEDLSNKTNDNSKN